MATLVNMNELKQDIGRHPATIDLMSEWSESLVSRFSAAMRARRKELDLSVQDVANRTKELGHSISRSTLSGLENNRNKDRLTLPDALVIAEVLRVPMLYLLFPEQPDGEVELVPGLSCSSARATDAIAGNSMIVTDGDTVEDAEGTLFVGRGKELESGYDLAQSVHVFKKLKETLWLTDPASLKEAADKGDQGAASELREYRLRMQVLSAHADSIRARGGVVNEDWFPDEESRDE